MRVIVLLHPGAAALPEGSGLGPREGAALQMARGLEADPLVAMCAAGASPDATLGRALASGAQRAIQVWLAAENGAAEPSALIARAAPEIGFDLILAGDQSDDRARGSFGPAVAHHLRLPHLRGVVQIERRAAAEITVTCLHQARLVRLVVVLPALLTVAGGPLPPSSPDPAADDERQIERLLYAPAVPGDPRAALQQTLPEIDLPLVDRGRTQRSITVRPATPRAELLVDVPALVACVRRLQGQR